MFRVVRVALVVGLAAAACTKSDPAPRSDGSGIPDEAAQHRAVTDALFTHIEGIAAVLRAAAADTITSDEAERRVAAVQPVVDAAVQARRLLGVATAAAAIAVYAELEPRRRRAFEEFAVRKKGAGGMCSGPRMGELREAPDCARFPFRIKHAGSSTHPPSR